MVVGAIHNTCNDSVLFFDVDRIPESHKRRVRRGPEPRSNRPAIATRTSVAGDSCRPRLRFLRAPPGEHVEERAEDLAQTRPELGHCTNAITIVGRRQWSRGLFLDRRAFLASYDPTEDDADRTILTRILQAVFPVCSGISLEYYFSTVDNAGFGCGTKLPHNLAALLGVMDGAASDLRTGLPWQMVEIHEPVRSLFVIETAPAAMVGIMDRDERNRPAVPQCLGTPGGDRSRDPLAQRFRGRGVPSLRASGRGAAAGRPRLSTGIAAGETTSNLRRSAVNDQTRSGKIAVATGEQGSCKTGDGTPHAGRPVRATHAGRFRLPGNRHRGSCHDCGIAVAGSGTLSSSVRFP